MSDHQGEIAATGGVPIVSFRPCSAHRYDTRPGDLQPTIRGLIRDCLDRRGAQGHIHVMPRWLEIVLTLVLFSASMAAGWVLNATVPAVHA